MSFPENVTTFLQAVDPSTVDDINNINQYQSLLNNGNFSDAQTFLSQMANGIQMNLNAGRYNEVLKTIEEIEAFYKGLGGVKEYITTNINAFTDLSQYSTSTDYKAGNIALYDGVWYQAKVDITQVGAGGTIITPGTTANWGNYWNILIQNQYQYKLSENEPSGLIEGDLWFKVLS